MPRSTKRLLSPLLMCACMAPAFGQTASAPPTMASVGPTVGKVLEIDSKYAAAASTGVVQSTAKAPKSERREAVIEVLSVSGQSPSFEAVIATNGQPSLVTAGSTYGQLRVVEVQAGGCVLLQPATTKPRVSKGAQESAQRKICFKEVSAADMRAAPLPAAAPASGVRGSPLPALLLN